MCCYCTRVPNWVNSIGCCGNMCLNIWLLIGTAWGIILMIKLPYNMFWFIAHLTDTAWTNGGGLTTFSTLTSCMLLLGLAAWVASRVESPQFATFISSVVSYCINNRILEIEWGMLLLKAEFIMQQVTINFLKIYRFQLSYKRSDDRVIFRPKSSQDIND